MEKCRSKRVSRVWGSLVVKPKTELLLQKGVFIIY